jgi:hypothetical protein
LKDETWPGEVHHAQLLKTLKVPFSMASQLTSEDSQNYFSVSSQISFSEPSQMEVGAKIVTYLQKS